MATPQPVDDPLSVSRYKVESAKERIEHLNLAIKRFFAPSEIYQRVRENHPTKTDQCIHKLRVLAPFPPAFHTLASEVIGHLRTALDNAVYAIAVASRQPVIKEAYFPFGNDSIDFENKMKGRCKHVPADILPTFRSFQPYRRGNDLLWALNQIAIADKHTLLKIAIHAVLVNLRGNGLVSIPLNPPWDSAKRELELGTFWTTTKVNYHLEFAFAISFDKIETLEDQPALAILDDLVGMVDSILTTLEAESRRLGYFN